MSGFKFDPSKPGLRKALREWEELALRGMWDVGEEGAKTKAVWERVNEGLGEGRSISRASIIVFLEKLEERARNSWIFLASHRRFQLKYIVTIRGSRDASFTVNANDLQEASSIVKRTITHHQGYSIKRAPHSHDAYSSWGI